MKRMSDFLKPGVEHKAGTASPVNQRSHGGTFESKGLSYTYPPVCYCYCYSATASATATAISSIDIFQPCFSH